MTKGRAALSDLKPITLLAYRPNVPSQIPPWNIRYTASPGRNPCRSGEGLPGPDGFARPQGGTELLTAGPRLNEVGRHPPPPANFPCALLTPTPKAPSVEPKPGIEEPRPGRFQSAWRTKIEYAHPNLHGDPKSHPSSISGPRGSSLHLPPELTPQAFARQQDGKEKPTRQVVGTANCWAASPQAASYCREE